MTGFNWMLVGVPLFCGIGLAYQSTFFNRKEMEFKMDVDKLYRHISETTTLIFDIELKLIEIENQIG